MSPDLQNQMSQISVSDFRAGLDHAEATTTRDAEATATRYATELAEEENQQTHQHLLAKEKYSAHSLAVARAEAKKADTRDCAIVVCSRVQAHERARAAVLHLSRNHEIQLVDLNNQPRQSPPPTSTHPTMAPPPPRPSSSTTATQTGRHTQPDTWAAAVSGTYDSPTPRLMMHTKMSGCLHSDTTTRKSPEPSGTKSTTCR